MLGDRGLLPHETEELPDGFLTSLLAFRQARHDHMEHERELRERRESFR